MSHLNTPCPLLPIPERPLTAADSKALGKDRGEAFYAMCLAYAQTKWQAGLPAQAILQLNRAMSADLSGDEAVLKDHPIPYAPMAWLLAERPDRCDQFIGNPRRHWQHYATRMSGERAELRTWRAWACWEIAGQILPSDAFPDDGEQIAKENLVLPSRDAIATHLDKLGIPNERSIWEATLKLHSPQ